MEGIYMERLLRRMVQQWHTQGERYEDKYKCELRVAFMLNKKCVKPLMKWENDSERIIMACFHNKNIW